MRKNVECRDTTPNFRILPKTVGLNLKPEENKQAAMTGYCKSLADHIVHHDSRPFLFRLFESKNHLSNNTEGDYNIYWLSLDGLQHIYERHGYHKLLPSSKNTDTTFNFDDDIVDLIKQAIVSSSTNNRGYTQYINDTTFQRGISQKKWKDSFKPANLTNIYQVRTETKSYYKIVTAFPLSPAATGSQLKK